MDDKAIAVMAIAFFATFAISIRALASVWAARIEARRYGAPTTAFADQLARIESERQGELLPKTPRLSEQRVITPH